MTCVNGMGFKTKESTWQIHLISYNLYGNIRIFMAKGEVVNSQHREHLWCLDWGGILL